ncbi:DUF397 domain-containing protein [Actinocorallia sp. B10E7]|uniref:DUF397 domain-containing protein n=1 Tax=Actinocorallia sp. B10E7 TaxID=3153558 RepID=UPI00325E89A3
MSQLTWRKSSRSNTESCVEVANGPGVLVRDSKNPEAGILLVGRSAWRALISELKDDG